MGVRRVKKADLKRIAKATGATFLTSLSNMEGEETFDANMVGEAAEVIQERISDDELIIIKGYDIIKSSCILCVIFIYIFTVPKLVQLLL